MNITDDNEKSKASSVQVISRAANILRALKLYPNGLSLGQIAKEVGLAKSTVQRIVNALEEEGFIVHSSTNSGFRLGYGLANLGSAVHFNLREDLHPFLQQLSAKIDETVDLAILDNGQAFFVDQITATHRLQAISKVGASFPLHCTANGKALLASMTLEMVKSVLPKTLNEYTSNTITSHTELYKELEIIRSNGIAYDREEHSIGICAIGATIHDAIGNLAAISIPLPAARFSGNEEKLIEELLLTCQAINQHYKY